MKRKIYFLLTIVFCFPGFIANAIQDSIQKQEDDKKFIRMLLKERKEKFAQYTEHLDDKSGFFGNQTKRDIKEVNEVLKEIVKTDNKIIMELDRLLDQRKFENFRSEYETKRASQELVQLQMENERLLAANDTLIKQLQVYRGPGAEEGGGGRTIYIFFTYFFGAILLLMLMIRLKKPRAKVDN